MIKSKQCNICLQNKKIEAFYTSYRNIDGFTDYCLDCKSAKKKKRIAVSKKVKVIKIKIIKSKKLKVKKEKITKILRSCSDCLKNKIQDRNKSGLCSRCYLKSYCKKNRQKYSKLYPLKSRHRREIKNKSTPSWIKNSNLKEIYQKCPKGFHVDHIIPLNNKNVCGLNVPWNLQILSEKENLFKKNKFDGSYDNNSWRKEI